MTGVLSAPERRYDALVNRIVDHCRQVEGQNLLRYHKIGSFFADFLRGLDSNRYGEATVEKLAEDLSESGALADISDHRRFLYWAKNIFDWDPEGERLDELAKIGFTVTHAKRIFALPREIREYVEQRMIVDGRVISSRDLIELSKQASAARIAEESAAAAREAADLRARADEEEATPPAPAVAAGDDGVPAETTNIADTPPLETPEGGTRPEGASSTGRPTIQERTIASPLKVLGGAEKLITKANSTLPDVFIVLRECERVAFDSDVAQRRYLDNLRQLDAAARSIIEPLQELVRGIGTVVRDADIPAPG